MLYKTAIKYVLPTNGRSMGTFGRSMKTHAIALQDIKIGRYKRSVGQFLCTQISGYKTEARDRDGAITCSVCLARAKEIDNRELDAIK